MIRPAADCIQSDSRAKRLAFSREMVEFVRLFANRNVGWPSGEMTDLC